MPVLGRVRGTGLAGVGAAGVVVGTVVPVICASDAVIVAAVGLPVLAEFRGVTVIV